MFVRFVVIAISSLLLVTQPCQAAQFDTTVPMNKKGAATFYVPVDFDGMAGNDLMVDTGSDYVTINRATLDLLQERGKVEYVKEVGGIMANGANIIVPIYRIANLNIGCCCIIRDVEAAVFDNTERQILGLSALKKLAPFAMSLEPAHLMLSGCPTSAAELARN